MFLRKINSNYFQNLLIMSFGTLSLFATSCKQDTTHTKAEGSYIPTFQEVDSVQKSNVAGAKIKNEDSLFATLSTYNIVVFGHYHTVRENYLSFQNYIPKLRKSGFLMLAVELPSSMQPLFDSIMDERTPSEQTKYLLDTLDKDLKVSDFNKKYDLSADKHHPLFDLILDWLKSGGMIVAVDVPYIYDGETRKTDYYSDMMLNTIKQQSEKLYLKVKNVDINSMDDKKDIRQMAEIRSAYMSALLDYYTSKGIKIVGFFGGKHTLLTNTSESNLGVSIVPISKNYFKTRIFSLYPFFTNKETGFFVGHQWVGDVAYAVKQSK